MKRTGRDSAAWRLAAVAALVTTVPAGAQFLSKPTRPQVETPHGAVRPIILKHCSSCHGIDDYAYNALDRPGWNALFEGKHTDFKALVADSDREVLLDWVVAKFGPGTKPFPRAYVPPEITTFFSDAEAQALLTRACTSCHAIEKVNAARYSPDRWRVVTVDMRERGARISDEELERLVEWLGRVKGTNPNQ
ncbi:MAG TPA: cytochrome c [Vicinamibacterales bacterium]|nr:cytochrome c [Vicinamibacterales bacterium]